MGEMKIIERIIEWCNINQGFLSTVSSTLLSSLTIATIIIAIIIPIHIMKRQNAVALFDKRYTAYSAFLRIKNFAFAIRDYDYTSNESAIYKNLLLVHIETSLGSINRLDLESEYKSSCAVIKNHEAQMYMLPFLMENGKSEKNKCSAMISNIFEPLLLLLTYIFLYSDKDEECNEKLKEFVLAVDSFENEYSVLIESLLLQ